MMSHGQQSDQMPPRPDEVRAALNRMVESELFRGSPQLASFLSFVVEAVLRGEAKRIKGYTIGTEALGRGPGFDPQIDPIVRVEATRLRRTMERYYAGPGADDPIVIGLLRGAYIPTFRWRGVTNETRADAEKSSTSGFPPVNALSRDQLAGALRPGNGMPTIGVQPFETIGTPHTQRISADALQEKVHDALSLFDTINVESEPPRGGDPAARTGQVSIDYRLFGSIEHREDGSIEARFRLLDTADGKLVWSRTFEPFPAAEAREAIEERIIHRLATTLMLPYGVVRANERIKYLSSRTMDPRNRCIVEILDALRSFDLSMVENARACLERLTAIDPGFTIGFAYLSAAYVRKFQLTRSARASDQVLLDRALTAARLAVELDPESSYAYQMLFNTLFVRREIAAAFAAADKTIALNKYNLLALSEYGGRLIMVGEVDRGMEMLERSTEYGTVLPSWHHIYLFLGNYLRGDLTEATYHANQAAGANSQFNYIASALAAAAADDWERARQALASLIAINPAWSSQPRQQLELFFPSAVIVDRLERDLAAAGLSTAANPEK